MAADGKPSKADYAVKQVETVARGADVMARIFTLAPGEIIPWHAHSNVADHFFVLSGRLTVETRAPDAAHSLGVGERFTVAPGNAHQTSNRGGADCRFLLVQGVGEYDWVKA